MLNAEEIVGFPEPSGARFGLVAELRRVRGAEITRITETADRLLIRFGPVIAIGFLYYEMLGGPPEGADCAGHLERLRRAPSAVPDIVEELRALADSQL